MSYKNEGFAMRAMRRCRAAVLGVLVLGLVEAGMMGACGSSDPGTSASTSSGGPPNPQAECPATVEVPCMRYHIPLVGNPSTDVALRSKYIAAFGAACYMRNLST